MPIKIQLRRGTAAQWASANPILSDGEFGYEYDTSKFKIGSGTASWTELNYFSSGLDPSTASTIYLPLSGSISWQNVSNKPDPIIGVNLIGSITGAASATLTDLTNAQITITTAGGGSASITNGIISTSVIVSPEERFNIITGSAAGTVNLDILTSAALYYASAGNVNFTVNVRGNASNSLNNILSVGDSITVALVNTTGTSASTFYATAFQVDGLSITPKWINGSPPPAAGGVPSVAGFDSYLLTLLKTASAVYSALGSWSQYR